MFTKLNFIYYFENRIKQLPTDAKSQLLYQLPL
jgi:hypothetical protein